LFVTRDHEDRLTLRIGSEINLIKAGDPQGDVTANVALFTRHLEDMVRRYPGQWSWLGFQRNSSQSKNIRPDVF
jgi:lauroyl/myristoyl acyltransferase